MYIQPQAKLNNEKKEIINKSVIKHKFYGTARKINK